MKKKKMKKKMPSNEWKYVSIENLFIKVIYFLIKVTLDVLLFIIGKKNKN